MNHKIDRLITEINSLCKEYEQGEGQAEVIYRLTSVVNKLTQEMRETLGFTAFDGKVAGDDKNGWEK